MDVIAHQDIRMQVAAIARQRIAKALQITLPVLVIEEARHPGVATMHYMLRHTGKIGTREHGHAAIIPGSTR
jgi:hypothetical protein